MLEDGTEPEYSNIYKYELFYMKTSGTTTGLDISNLSCYAGQDDNTGCTLLY